LCFGQGGQNGLQKCQKNNAQNILNEQVDLIQIKEKVNAAVISTGTDDIRRCLQQKYTIAD
jgi:hypothetical protein